MKNNSHTGGLKMTGMDQPAPTEYATVGHAPIFKRVRKTAKSDYYLNHVFPSVRPPAWINLALTGRIFMKFDI